MPTSRLVQTSPSSGQEARLGRRGLSASGYAAPRQTRTTTSLPGQSRLNVRLVRQTATASESVNATTSGKEVEYKDSWSDMAFVNLCRKAYGAKAGWQSSKMWWDGAETYAGMVEVSRALMKGRSARQQRDAVISGFPQVPGWFRKLFPYSRWGAELNARITPAFFTWLVGPMQTVEAEVDEVVQRSAVKIERCRYLAESGCVGMCINLCKSPVQEFFTSELGMPLTMKPNFEDYSCEMVFGKVPPPLKEDEAMLQPCLSECAGRSSAPPAVTSRCEKLV